VTTEEPSTLERHGPVADLGSATRGLDLSLVIPTRNEAGNIRELIDQLALAIPVDVRVEIIFVDDSSDDTPDVIGALAHRSAIPIRMNHREDPVGGLGGAVVEGLRMARAPWVVVMDADLQHPPEVVAHLLAAGRAGNADLVVASRYASGGDRSGLSGRYRRYVSGGSTLVTKLAFGRALRGVSDPMSGFFAVRRDAVNPTDLRPLGYKILLELVVQARPKRVAEVPYTFGVRHAGESKSSLREGVKFLRHLVGLRLRSAGVGGRAVAFGAVGASGIAPNLVISWLLTSMFGVHYLPSAVIASQVAIGWNFLLIDRVVFRHRRTRHWSGRFGRFVVLSNVDLVLRLPALALLVELVGMNFLIATLATLVAAFALRFLVTDRAIYRGRTA
jgi:dolichol-phosphate mannosyltransferase